MKPGGYNETWAEWTATAKPQMVESKPHFLHRNIKAAGFHLNSFKSFWQTFLYSIYWLLYVLIYILFLSNEYIFSSVWNNFKTQDCSFWTVSFLRFHLHGGWNGWWTQNHGFIRVLPCLQKGLRVRYMSVVCFHLKSSTLPSSPQLYCSSCFGQLKCSLQM